MGEQALIEKRLQDQNKKNKRGDMFSMMSLSASQNVSGLD